MDKKFAASGLGFFEVLVLIFIVLKIVGVIEWSWWWVLCPIWIPFIIFVVIVVTIAIKDPWILKK